MLKSRNGRRPDAILAAYSPYTGMSEMSWIQYHRLGITASSTSSVSPAAPSTATGMFTRVWPWACSSAPGGPAAPLTLP